MPSDPPADRGESRRSARHPPPVSQPAARAKFARATPASTRRSACHRLGRPGAGHAGRADGVPIPQGIVTPWKPPGIVGPWPADEYLWDGGEKYPVVVDSNLEIKGLALEDTVVHYDTIDGRTVVEPSNRVVIYSPRFGAVREVTAALASQQEQGSVQADKPVGPVQYEEDQLATTALQPVQPVGEIGTKLISIEKANQPVVSCLQPPAAGDDGRSVACRSRITKSFVSACLHNRSRPRCKSASRQPSPGRPIRRRR